MSTKPIDYNNYISITSLIAFYEENKDRIYMREYGNHPINKEGFARWKENLLGLHNISRNKTEITTYMKFAEVLEHSIRYITFPEYMSVINKLSDELIKLIRETDTVCFILGEGINRSNFWTTLLFIGELNKKGLHGFLDKVFCFGINHVHSIVNLKKNRPGSFVIVACDDMTYTGEQMKEKEFIERNLRCVKPCPKNEYEQIKFYVVVPYTTSIAKSKLMSPPPEGIHANYFESTIELSTFSEQVSEYYKNEPDTIKHISLMCSDSIIEKQLILKNNSKQNNYLNIKRGHNSFVCVFGLGQTAVYFDHKLADHVSVMQKLFAKGSYPPNISYNNVKAKFLNREKIKPLYDIPLISGCDETRQEEDCFYTFYKNITYTYFGNTIVSNCMHIIRLFKDIEKKYQKRSRGSKSGHKITRKINRSNKKQ